MSSSYIFLNLTGADFMWKKPPSLLYAAGHICYIRIRKDNFENNTWRQYLIKHKKKKIVKLKVKIANIFDILEYVHVFTKLLSHAQDKTQGQFLSRLVGRLGYTVCLPLVWFLSRKFFFSFSLVMVVTFAVIGISFRELLLLVIGILSNYNWYKFRIFLLDWLTF